MIRCMKKPLSLVLCLLLLLSAAAPAAAQSAPGAILMDGWQSAPASALKEARQLLDAQINRLAAAPSPSDTAPLTIFLEGSGTKIISDLSIPFAPARITLKGNMKLTLTGGDYDRSYNSKTYYVEPLLESGTFDALIESSENWSIAIEPIKDGGIFSMSGNGPFVSDFIPLSGAMILTITGDPAGISTGYTSFYVSLAHQYDYSENWTTANLRTGGMSDSDKPYSADLIVKPIKGRSQYFIVVECSPGLAWTITPKE